MDVVAWQKRLEAAFSTGDVVGARLFEVVDLEKECGRYFVNTFHGQSVLMHAFQDFYIESLRASEAWVAKNGWPAAEYYGALVLTYLTAFRSFRACENLLLRGYPLDGFALLRDVKDRALHLCGIARNATTWSLINSMDTRERKAAERKTVGLLLGEDSEMPPDDAESIRQWEEMFHQEVHGSKLTLMTEMSRLMKGDRLSVGPLPDDRQLAMYMNRAVETGWLYTRLLPYLQPNAAAFGAEWAERQAILDESFRASEQALADMGKPIASAFIRFVDCEFSFGGDFHYIEADGSGGDG